MGKICDICEKELIEGGLELSVTSFHFEKGEATDAIGYLFDSWKCFFEFLEYRKPRELVIFVTLPLNH